MHYIIGLITANAGLVWALNSLQNAGFNINSLNPFAWARRRRWEKKLGTKPMHALTDTMDAAALLVVSVVREKGDIARETKVDLLELFEKEFGVNRSQSLELFSSSTYMLKDVLSMAHEVRNVLKPSKDEFTPSHIQKLTEMLQIGANLEGEPTKEQIAILEEVGKEFNAQAEKPTNW